MVRGQVNPAYVDELMELFADFDTNSDGAPALRGPPPFHSFSSVVPIDSPYKPERGAGRDRAALAQAWFPFLSSRPSGSSSAAACQRRASLAVGRGAAQTRPFIFAIDNQNY